MVHRKFKLNEYKVQTKLSLVTLSGMAGAIWVAAKRRDGNSRWSIHKVPVTTLIKRLACLLKTTLKHMTINYEAVQCASPLSSFPLF
jgi:hypothetical protein